MEYLRCVGTSQVPYARITCDSGGLLSALILQHVHGHSLQRVRGQTLPSPQQQQQQQPFVCSYCCCICPSPSPHTCSCPQSGAFMQLL